jgi:hypothetical protein
MRIRGFCLATLCALLLALAAGASPAQASRALLTEAALKPNPAIPAPPPEGEIEDACGAAVTPGGGLYVSDYYHHAVDLFSSFGGYEGGFTTAGPPEGPCGLALDSSGALYANIWHQGVVRLRPSFLSFDAGESTGVAVDSTEDVYVDDRTYVAVYEPSGAPVLAEGEPPGGQGLQIGLGSLGDAYGLAVFADKVYVPDVQSETVKVYELATHPDTPVATVAPPGGFNSLVDAATAVDPTNGHLLVVDNLQPGFEHPKAAVDEFDSSGAFLGRLSGSPIDGEPSGIAVDPAGGDLFVTDGNDEEANVFAYGPYTASLAVEAAPSPATSRPSNAPSLAAFAAAQPAAAGGQGTSARQRQGSRRLRHKHRRHRPGGAKRKRS